MKARLVPVGTLCRIDDVKVSWDDPEHEQLDMYVTQEPDENLYFAIVLQHDVKPNRCRGIVRCLALGFETGSDNTFWMLGSQELNPL